MMLTMMRMMRLVVESLKKSFIIQNDHVFSPLWRWQWQVYWEVHSAPCIHTDQPKWPLVICTLSICTLYFVFFILYNIFCFQHERCTTRVDQTKTPDKTCIYHYTKKGVKIFVRAQKRNRDCLARGSHCFKFEALFKGEEGREWFAFA